MNKEFQKYSLEDFLDDRDFCSWARSERPDLDGFYQRLINEYPEQKKVLQNAYKLVRLFDDEKVATNLSRKLQWWEKVKSTYQESNKPTKNYRLIFRYAAVFVLLATVGSMAYYFMSPNSRHDFVSSYAQQDFKETTLLLGNGKKVNIKSQQAEIKYDSNGTSLLVDNDLVDKGVESKGTEMNELTVSFGKQAKIVLADNTTVWLNAGSRLIYPSRFRESKRKVQLQGEAFFKVSKDKTKPFIIETGNSNIKVLGTSFNVKAYPDEQIEETVLVEGSVSLNIGKTSFGKEVMLKPEQRVVVSGTDNTYAVSKVDVENYTSWINGLFEFKDEPLSAVLTRISRYYHINIKWADNADARKISGKLDLKDDYQRVLHALAVISNGDYSEKDKEIYFKLNN